MSQPLILHPKTTEPLQPQSVSDLHQTSNLLHLIHYRNKNQHRRAKWWKDFSTFRREVRRVLELSIPASEEPERKGKGSFQRRREVRDGNVRRREMAMARVGFWKDARLVEGWYTAFTHLTASTRFSTLGLVLVACLSSVCRITNIIQAFENEAQEELHALLARFANEEGENLFGQGKERGQAKEVDNEDPGERITREEIAYSRAEEAVGELMSSSAKRPRLEEREDAVTFHPSAVSGGLGSGIVTGEQDIRVTETPPEFPAKRRSGEDAVDAIEGLPKQRLQTSIVMTGQVRVAPKKKRKKGKADAIDDIFGDL